MFNRRSKGSISRKILLVNHYQELKISQLPFRESLKKSSMLRPDWTFQQTDWSLAADIHVDLQQGVNLTKTNWSPSFHDFGTSDSSFRWLIFGPALLGHATSTFSKAQIKGQ